MLECLTQVFDKHGFVINLNKGKSEGIIIYRRVGSTVAHNALYSHNHMSGVVSEEVVSGTALPDTITPVNKLYKIKCRHDMWLSIVDSYKHVGTTLSADGK